MTSSAVATPPTSFNLRTLEEIEGIIAGVARSIERLDDGTYGSCEHCGIAIAPELLSEDPLSVRCTTHMVKERPELFAEVPTETAVEAVEDDLEAADEFGDNDEVVAVDEFVPVDELDDAFDDDVEELDQ